MDASQLTPATLRLAGDDLYTHAADVGLHVDFGDYERPKDAHEALDSTLVRHASGSAHGDGIHPGADLSYRLAVVDAAFRPNRAVERRHPSDKVREQLEELIKPALKAGVHARDVVDAFEHAHTTRTRAALPAQIAGMVKHEALLFLTLECSVRGESAVVNGAEVNAMALFDYQETTLSLDAIQGVSDPFNWPKCNSAFKSVDAIEGTYWESPVAYGVDIMEVFSVPFLDFETHTPLSITYVDADQQKAMIYGLSEANFHLGDKQVVIDRGFARVVDLGHDLRRVEALKVVHFGDDEMSNATSWFSCLWWDLLSVRTAVLCPNRTVTSKETLEKLSNTTSSSTLAEPAEPAEPTPGQATPGPLESLAQAWGDVVLELARESTGVATRTAKRWPPGEQVTGGKLTSDLIEGFERLTPSVGKAVDVWLKAFQHGLGQVVPGTTEQQGDVT